ncbi:hypothetical protein F6X37_09320 [Paraburkholderia sp. 31.1]|uniref:hypothetical protein n=1 Tax=Paraburkholderia sp. 31.1 TaxID=2615205 RepID=UPI001655F5B5|nr:hypothetical protein [Paraburkholderia sp. 31.1]MBC8721785.1 hypothetical protein [Paraburkholderia sp. 31.1]
MGQQKQAGAAGEEECQVCRVTYSIYANFPPMPSAMAMNVETGEWFPQDRLRLYSNGYEMADALGYAWACDCRGRTAASALTSKIRTHDEYYVLKKSDGQPLANVRYRIVVDGKRVITGTTSQSGHTVRVVTRGTASLKLQLEK